MMRFQSACVAGLLLVSLTNCQSLGRRNDSGAITHGVERAHESWLALQRAKPGTAAAQQALDRYNLAVTQVVSSVRHGARTNPLGTLVAFDTPAVASQSKALALAQFSECRVAADVSARHFEKKVIKQGLGVPVVLIQNDEHRVTQSFHPPHGEFLSATAVLEFPTGSVTDARLRFYDPFAVSTTQVGHHPQPLASNLTAALQFSLTDAILNELKPAGATPSASGEETSQLFFLNRYDPTKIPVVFVHGLLSEPGVWKNAVNAMYADPELRRRYQPVCFEYPSTLPIPASAARLRELLKTSRDKLDPNHHDGGFGRIIIVGHSMGGLITRLQVIDSGSSLWRSFFSASPQQVAKLVDAQTQRMLRSALFFKHADNVRTVVFISTPHRGSELADIGILRAAARIVLFIPKTAKNRIHALTELPSALIHPTLRTFHDWGVDGTENLSTKHPLFRALAQRAITVPFYSIIGTRHALDPHLGSDGVVPYSSAHLKGSVSEDIVPYGHGCLEKPLTVDALMNILKTTL